MQETQKMTVADFLFRGIDPCLDGNCVIKAPTGGMVTNGGCRCITNLPRGQLNLIANRLRVIKDAQVDIPVFKRKG